MPGRGWEGIPLVTIRPMPDSGFPREESFLTQFSLDAARGLDSLVSVQRKLVITRKSISQVGWFHWGRSSKRWI